MSDIAEERFVEALYRGLLMREPDAPGLAHKVGRLVRGEAVPQTIVDEIVASEEFVHALPDLLNRSGGAAHRRFTNDVSQYGEMWELLKMWVNDAAVAKIVVDVGARGRARSNSYDLMRHFGWRGLLIEANADLIDGIRAEFAGLDLTIASCAVSDYTGEGVLTLGVNADVSSLTAQLAADWGPTQGDSPVQVRRLSEILEEHGVPHEFDLVSIDIEGEDIKVLNDLIDNSPYRPRWAIIEASDDFAVKTLDDAPFSDHVKRAYAMRGQTSSNLILALRPEVPDAP